MVQTLDFLLKYVKYGKLSNNVDISHKSLDKTM